MDYNELLFAAEVRRLAVEIRNSEWTEYSNSGETVIPKGDRAAFYKARQEWEEDHPLQKYLLLAVSHIRSTASYLRTLPLE